MSQLRTIRIAGELLARLKDMLLGTGAPVKRHNHHQQQSPEADGGNKRFMRHAGAIVGGAANLSSRKGFYRP